MPQTNIYLIPSIISKRVKIILSERNDPNRFPQSKLLKKIRVLLYQFSDIIVFQTNDAKNFFNKTIQKKGVIIPNPIKEDLPYVNVGKRKREIVNFCRLAPQKNLKMLIDAFSMLCNDHPNFKLSIYGRGPLESELREYAEKLLGKDKVTISNYTENIHDKIKDSAMFVSSSDYEGMSNSMLESMAIGLPTICTDCPIGGARMVIKQYENGLLVPVGDTVALYRAMKEVVENEELSNKLSKNATRIRKELSTQNIFVKWLEVIESF